MSHKTFDYVIVGAGSAGCTLANRLSEDPACSVALLEAGGWDYDPWIKIPLGWGRIFGKRLHDWMYFTEPEGALLGRRIECARGKVIGGSSSINAMAYVRGNAIDYARWAKAGCTLWSYPDVLPWFKKQETWEGGETAYRGGSGPLSTITSHYEDPVVEAWLAAGEAMGLPRNADYNAGVQDGVALIQSTIRKGRRCSAADAYLRPALARPNLTVVTGALAQSILFEGKRATGISYRRRGMTVKVAAEREVILCGGTINSPQLLMLSGIGPAEELGRHGISIRVALPGVGENLQDHLSVGVEYQRKQAGPFQQHMRADRIVSDLAKAYILGKGYATELPSGWTAFLRTQYAKEAPDIQLLFRGGPMTGGPWLAPFKPPFEDGFACRSVLLRPESRGRIRLASADPAAAPLIYQNALSADADWRTMRAGLRAVIEMGRQQSLGPFIARQTGPTSLNPTDDDLDRLIRETGATAHHPLGTCRMGADTDEHAVVDPLLRVRGVEALRVVDASVMPDLVGGNINGPVIMIAERAADFIRYPDRSGRTTGAIPA